MVFNFNLGHYISLREKVEYLKGNESVLEMSSDFDDNTKIIHQIPFGTGVPIFMLIYSDKDYYNISINGGDYIHFPHIVPSWAVNLVVVSCFFIGKIDKRLVSTSVVRGQGAQFGLYFPCIFWTALVITVKYIIG